MRGRMLVGAVAVSLMAATMSVVPATASVGGVVAINELMPAPVAADAEFLELRNLTASPVDVSGWCFTDGIAACLPPGTMIPGDGFLLMVQDEAIARAEYGIPPSTPLYVYSGGQKGAGETITLVDAGSAIADSVTYLTDPPWPTDPGNGLASLERINPAIASSNFANWDASSSPWTPGAENSVYDPGGGPSFFVTDLFATPFRPNPGQSFVVTADLTESASSIDLTYAVNFDSPVTVAMSNAGGNSYEATIPGQGAGDLVRFRVDADSGSELAARPAAGDSITYEGIVVLDPADASAAPVIEWFMEDAVYDDLLANHRFDDVTGPAVVSFEGVVYDAVQMRVRGDHSRAEPKVSWKVEFPPGHLFDMGGMLHEPVDEFNMQRDQWPLAGQGWQIVADALQPEIDFIFIRQQRNGDFWGVGAYGEAADGRWRNRNKYDDDSYYKVVDSKLKPYSSEANARNSGDFEKKEGDPNDFTDIYELTQGIDLGGQAELDFYFDNMDIPALVNYLAVLSLIRHYDSFNQNYRITRDSETLRWELLHWDLDDIFRADDPGDPRNGFPTAPLLDNRLYQSFFDYPELEELFYRRIKTMRDEMMPPALHDYFADTVNSMLDDYDLEDSTWGHSGSTSSKISNNFDRIQYQRDTIDDNTAPSGPVPTSQPANPRIVINEIQYDPTGGPNAEFVELHNLESTPIDLSGWALANGVTYTLRGGTVIPAGGYLVFAKSSPTFISTYGSGIYVGGDYNGKLNNGGELIRLLDETGAEVDAVDYLPTAPWPTSGDGPSIEKIDPDGPGNNPANWGRSAGDGSPGERNSLVVPEIRPFGTVVTEGDSGSQVADARVLLESSPGVPFEAPGTITVEWTTHDIPSNPAVAASGSDYDAASGTLTFDPGETEATVPLTVHGDTDFEPDLLYGEWALLVFSNQSPNARLNLSFYGLGLVIIVNDD